MSVVPSSLKANRGCRGLWNSGRRRRSRFVDRNRERKIGARFQATGPDRVVPDRRFGYHRRVNRLRDEPDRGASVRFVGLITISWFQERAESGLLGRVMSLAMFSAVALDPISFALAGILVGINLTAMFVGAGALLLYYGDAGSGEPYDARSGLGQRVFCGGVIEERLSDGRTCDPGPPPYL